MEGKKIFREIGAVDIVGESDNYVWAAMIALASCSRPNKLLRLATGKGLEKRVAARQIGYRWRRVVR